jgi:hypothetical protein
MTALTITIEPDEFSGLFALVQISNAADKRAPADADLDSEVVSRAKTLMRRALADELQQAGLPWAPDPAAGHERAAEVAEPAHGVYALAENEKVRKDAGYVLAVAGLIALFGGYVGGWRWTGFQANGQVWDWLNLLLLPVVLGTIPLWIQHREFIGKGRQAIYGIVIAAWAGFTIAGYLVPISWTGFRDQKLWNWIDLLVLPAALAITAALTGRGIRSRGRLLSPYERGIVAALAAGWIVTVIGGYALRWTWTGYHGNTLWDWLSMLLVPLVFPTILLPALLKWISGNAAQRASQAHQTPAGPPAAAAGG